MGVLKKNYPCFGMQWEEGQWRGKASQVRLADSFEFRAKELWLSLIGVGAGGRGRQYIGVIADSEHCSKCQQSGQYETKWVFPTFPHTPLCSSLEILWTATLYNRSCDNLFAKYTQFISNAIMIPKTEVQQRILKINSWSKKNDIKLYNLK